MKCRESYIKWSVLNFNTDHLDRNVNKVSVNQRQSMPTDKGVSLKVDFLGTLFSVYTFDIKKKGTYPMVSFKIFKEWSPIPTKQRMNNIKNIQEVKFSDFKL